MKIRHKFWYWGKYIISGTKLDSSYYTINSDGFEEYIEELHGWHNSEEFKIHGRAKYETN